jgi:hypothetical protein
MLEREIAKVKRAKAEHSGEKMPDIFQRLANHA